MRQLTIGIAASLLLTIAEPVSAQFAPPSAPYRPAAVSPNSGAVLRGTRPAGTMLDFVWDQPGALLRPFIDPPAPQAFAICVRAANLSTPCTWPGLWNASAAGIPRKPLRNLAGVVTGYRYTLRPTVPLADTWLDRPIAWTVLACANANGTACSTSAPQPLHVTSIDLMPDNVSIGGSTSTDLIVTGSAINRGSGGPTTSVRSDLLSLPAMLESIGRCATDVNHSDYANVPGLGAVLRNGTLVPFDALPKLADGTYDTGDVRAIIRTSDPVLVGDFALISASNLVPGLRPVQSQTLSTSVPAANRPLGVVSILIIDGPRSVVEYDETNNALVECTSLN